MARAEQAGKIRHSAGAFERSEQRAGDDMALDLGGAIPDALDAGVAPEAGERQVVHQPHAAVDLDRLSVTRASISEA